MKIKLKLELKMFYQTWTACRLPKSPPAVTEWSRPLLLHAVCSEHIPFLHCREVTGVLSAFLSLVIRVFCPWWLWPFTFDHDLQTRPSKGSNTISLWILHKSVQQFPRFQWQTKKQKSHRQHWNRTLLVCDNKTLSSHGTSKLKNDKH